MEAPPNYKKVSLPIHVPILIPTAGAAEVSATFSLVYCREDNTGVCRIKTLQWQAPVEAVNDSSAANELRLTGKVSAD